MLRRTLLAALMSLTAAAAMAQTAAPPVTVLSPWARATPPGAKVGAAYMQLKATPGAGDTLVSVSSSVAATAEIHNHIMEGGVARMRRVDGIAIPGGGGVALEPGGYHVMLMGLKEPLKPGMSFKMKLAFAKAPPLEVEVEVRPLGSSSGAARGHHGH